jgi:nicotinate-nucleotide adenylyltransferase
LYFGSFNPVHTGHLIIAQYFATFTDLEEIWFVVSAQNPFKAGHDMPDGQERLELVNIAISGNPALASCGRELELEKPSYTIHTLNSLEATHPGHSFVLIMGSDNLVSLPRWKDYLSIISRFDIYVYPRPGFENLPEMVTFRERVTVVKAPLLDISSSFVRQMISEGKVPRYWLPEGVWQRIQEKNLYS